MFVFFNFETKRTTSEANAKRYTWKPYELVYSYEQEKIYENVKIRAGRGGNCRASNDDVSRCDDEFQE